MRAGRASRRRSSRGRTRYGSKNVGKNPHISKKTRDVGHPNRDLAPTRRVSGRCPNSTEGRAGGMRGAVYNSAIPAIFKSMNRGWRSAFRFSPAILFLLFSFPGMVIVAGAADWNRPEEELARKIAAVTGPGAIAFTVENRSSL